MGGVFKLTGALVRGAEALIDFRCGWPRFGGALQGGSFHFEGADLLRALGQLQEMRDGMRKQNSSQFA